MISTFFTFSGIIIAILCIYLLILKKSNPKKYKGTSPIMGIIVGLLLFLGGNIFSGSNNTNSSKTSFKDCDELKSHFRWYDYDELKNNWGLGKVSEPYMRDWETGEMAIDIKWNNITVKGKAVDVTFSVIGLSTNNIHPHRFLSIDYNICQ